MLSVNFFSLWKPLLFLRNYGNLPIFLGLWILGDYFAIYLFILLLRQVSGDNISFLKSRFPKFITFFVYILDSSSVYSRYFYCWPVLALFMLASLSFKRKLGSFFKTDPKLLFKFKFWERLPIDSNCFINKLSLYFLNLF